MNRLAVEFFASVETGQFDEDCEADDLAPEGFASRGVMSRNRMPFLGKSGISRISGLRVSIMGGSLQKRQVRSEEREVEGKRHLNYIPIQEYNLATDPFSYKEPRYDRCSI